MLSGYKQQFNAESIGFAFCLVQSEPIINLICINLLNVTFWKLVFLELE